MLKASGEGLLQICCGRSHRRRCATDDRHGFMLAFEGLFRGDPFLSVLMLGSFPLLVALAITLVGALLIGLPLSAVLQQTQQESRAAYVVAGAAAGFLLPQAFRLLQDVSNYFLSLLLADVTLEVWWFGSVVGTISGVVAGNVWWTCRRAAIAQSGS